MNLKDNYIYVFNKFENIDNFLCFIESKEIFVNNSFEEVNYVIIKSGDSPSKRRKIFLKQFLKKYGEPKKKYSVDKFFKTYKNEIIRVQEFLDKNNYEFSFLEKYQFAYMLCNQKDTDIEKIYDELKKTIELILVKY